MTIFAKNLISFLSAITLRIVFDFYNANDVVVYAEKSHTLMPSDSSKLKKMSDK